MINALAMTAGTSVFGLVTGFVFRLIGESRRSNSENMQLAIKALSARDLSADNASKRPSTGWLRWFFGVAVVLAVIIAPIAIAYNPKVELMYPITNNDWSILWGLWKHGGTTTFQAVGGYPYIPEALQAFNLYISFVVGQKPAK
jgi:hypothetical protein